MIRLLALLILAAPAFGDELHVTASSGPFMPMPFTNVVVDVPKFDPALGQLQAVYIRVVVDIAGTISVENTMPHPFGSAVWSPQFYAYANMSTSWCSSSDGPWQQAQYVPILPAFDGTLDYSGPSGTVESFGPHWGHGMNNDGSTPGGEYHPPGDPYGMTSPGVLALFTGTGTIPFTTSANPGMIAEWDPQAIPYVFAMNGGVSVSITYTYNLAPVRFCLALSPQWCPCNLPGAVNGCPNSQNAAGANLTTTGQPSFSTDTLALHASGMPDNATHIYFQGYAPQHYSVPFGDGVRCVSGSTVRLGIKQASAGASHYPDTGDAPLSTTGSGYRAYQVWYRDPADFCTPATFNLTSAVGTVWTP